MKSVPGGWISTKKFIPVTDLSFVLGDYEFWAKHQNELDSWCTLNECERVGMIVTANNVQAKMLFILRWS